MQLSGWMKYLLVFGLGWYVGQNPNVIVTAANGLQNFLTSLGHG